MVADAPAFCSSVRGRLSCPGCARRSQMPADALARTADRLLASLVTLCLVLAIAFARPARAQEAPLLKVLDQFTAADVPTSGPTEPGPTTRTWWDPTTNPSTVSSDLPGKGIAQHPMLYAGEGYNTLFVVKDGKVV